MLCVSFGTDLVAWYPLSAHRYPRIHFEHGKTCKYKKILTGTLLRIQKESFAKSIYCNRNSWRCNVLGRIQRIKYIEYFRQLRVCFYENFCDGSASMPCSTALLSSSPHANGLLPSVHRDSKRSATFLPQTRTPSFTAFYRYKIKAKWLFLSDNIGSM
jgi:hypothetical protein